MYFNFTTQTTNNPLYNCHKNIRRDVKSALLKKFKWIENQEFEEYIKTLQKYKFCICPPGRGIDTHICWEALMVGTIPIVLSSPFIGKLDFIDIISISGLSFTISLSG